MNGMTWIRIGAILGGLSVALGAFAAHGLESSLKASEPVGDYPVERRLQVFETGARYQMYHALAILGIGLIALSGRGGAPIQVAGWSFLAGTLIFSGSLYALGYTGIKWLGAITPIGGVGFLVGWVALAFASATKPLE